MGVAVNMPINANKKLLMQNALKWVYYFSKQLLNFEEQNSTKRTKVFLLHLSELKIRFPLNVSLLIKIYLF